MSSSKHTEAFNQSFNKSGIAEPTFAQSNAFVLRLSEETSEQVVSEIANKTGKKYVTNKEIYIYCKENGIEPDHDPYDNYQSKIDFTKQKPDYSEYKSMDDIDIEGRTGFVLSNDVENKKITVEFDDNDEMKTISYE